MSTSMGGDGDHVQPRRQDEGQGNPVFDQPGAGAPPTYDEEADDPSARTDRERDAYGGLKWGSAFFGWVTATGMVVFASAVLAGIGALINENTNTDLGQIAEDPQSAGWIGGGILLAVILLAYICGGFVAGRMARFDGGRQGLAVWLWTILMAAIVTAVGLSIGERLDVTEQLSGLPTIPIEEGDRTLAAAITGAAVLAVALIGALLGGTMGMRFHRKVDSLSGGDRI
ncbi:MAG: hypothetical protein WBG36_03995 [Ornithinimicrobium sp.]